VNEKGWRRSRLVRVVWGLAISERLLARFQDNFVRKQIFLTSRPKIYQDKVSPEVFNRSDKRAFSWQNDPGFLGSNWLDSFQRIAWPHAFLRLRFPAAELMFILCGL
jgi:hypothetical protein